MWQPCSSKLWKVWNLTFCRRFFFQIILASFVIYSHGFIWKWLIFFQYTHKFWNSWFFHDLFYYKEVWSHFLLIDNLRNRWKFFRKIIQNLKKKSKGGMGFLKHYLLFLNLNTKSNITRRKSILLNI